MKKTLAILLSSLTLASFGLTSTNNLQNPELQNYINESYKLYGIPKAELAKILEKATYDPKVIDRINHPYEEKPWDVYRKLFITPQRIQQGLAYLHQHETLLNKLQDQYGVPASIIVAIVGVETNYGEHIGDFSALNALYTLSFYYPSRQTFFRRQLAELILLSQQDNMSLDELQASYAGALGIPQFMPDTYRQYAIDYDKNAKVDLLRNHDDALASIANFLNKKGWKAGMNIADQFRAKQVNPEWVSDKAIPTRSIAEWKKLGVWPEDINFPNDRAAIIALKLSGDQKPEYWLSYPNFRVIMSYNPRITYAMAVYQLSQGIDEAYGRELAAKNPRPAPAQPAAGSTSTLRENTQQRTQ